MKNKAAAHSYLDEKQPEPIAINQDRANAAFEELLAREKEKELLYTIASAIANIQDRFSLMKFILNEIKHIFNFYDVGLVVLNPDGINGIDWAIHTPQIDPSLTNYELNTKGLQLFPYKNSLLEKLVKKAQVEGNPVIVKFDDQLLAENPDLKPILEVEIQHGYKETLFTYLKCGDKIIGTFNMNSLEDNHFQASQFNLFQAVADLIAVAVANILANEGILAREKEKSILLSISEAIASINNRKQLLKVIYERIRPIFPFDNAGLYVIDVEKDQFYEILDGDAFPDGLQQQLTEQKKLGPWPLSSSNPQSWWMQDKISINTMLAEANLTKDYLGYEQFEAGLAYGLKQLIAGPLRANGKRIGAICFNSKEEGIYTTHHLPMFKSISEQLGVALANILAKEEILVREKEKENLLAISNAIATIRNKNDLFRVVSETIQPILGYEKLTHIFKIDAPNNSVGLFLRHATQDIAQDEAYQQFIQQKFDYKGSAFETVVNTGGIFLLDPALMIQQHPEHPGFALMLKLGLRQSMIASLNYAGKTIGTFHVFSTKNNHFSAAHFSFFEAVANTLAIAVANINANEEISNKAREIETLNNQLQAQNAYLVREVEQVYNFEEMIGQNPKFIEVCQSIGLVANTSSTALILGETGTGKELVARAIHNNSPRKNKPLIKLNCAALPANLIESELFGHERGAFTGAVDRRIGKFELAHGSTLFLDEVGELPLELQAKLLRALQEKEIERLGSNKTLQIDVRIIAATNRDLLKEVQAGTFRQDLYYRLHIFPITLPPLRERKEDIPLLALHFIERYAKKIGKKIQGFSSNAMQEMMRYNWPGNIRELEHVIERCVILCQTKLIEELNLPDVAKNKTASSPREFVLKTWEEQERDYILEVLKITNGNVRGKGGAADLLQLAPSTLQSKMLKLGIKRKHYSE